MLRIMQILWPAFLMATVGVGLLFSMVDPDDLVIFGHPMAGAHLSAYGCGFLLLWALCSASAATSLWLAGNLAGAESHPPK